MPKNLHLNYTSNTSLQFLIWSKSLQSQLSTVLKLSTLLSFPWYHDIKPGSQLDLMETRIPRNPTIKETWNSMNLMSRNSFNTYMIYRSRQTFNNRIHHIFLFPPWKYFWYGLKNNPSHFHPNINTDKDNFDRS